MKAIYLNKNIKTVDWVFSEETQRALGDKLEILGKVRVDDMDSQRDILKQAECILSTWGMPALTGEQIDEYLPNLKIVFYGAGSVQYFARPFIERGIHVCSSWQANGIPVAENVMSLILLSNKGYFRRADDYRADKTKSIPNDFPGNFGCKIGLIGFGVIGRKVAELMKPFRVNILAYDPFVSDEVMASRGVKRATLEEIFSECQTISNHLPNLDSTKKMLTYDLFKLMKPNATFINTGRGAQLIEDDLARAMKEAPRRTALLDVTWPEPCPAESPFWSLPNVILTPHLAGSLGDEVMRMGEYMLEECERYLDGKPLVYDVSMEMLERMA